MAMIALFGALTIVGLYLVNRAVPNVSEIVTDTAGKQENEKSKEIGVANIGEEVKQEVKYIDPDTGQVKTEERVVPKGPYGQCVGDVNCQGNAFIGATNRCINAQCTPMVRSESGIRFNPYELGLNRYCGRFYLLGQGNPCKRDSQCSNNGITCDINDPNCTFSGPTSDYYCTDNGHCGGKSNKDWLGIRWKWEDLTPGTRNSLGFLHNENANKTRIGELSQINSCPELRSLQNQIVY